MDSQDSGPDQDGMHGRKGIQFKKPVDDGMEK
jgi:hypothetical protein